jgi:hypothetical protein
MFDSVDVAGLPVGGDLYAGYVDGRYENAAAIKARFPNVPFVGIAVTASTNDGTVLDVERYDATPAQAPGWVKMRRLAGVEPSVYCAEDAWATVKAAFVAAGIQEPPYWVAAYPGGGPGIPAGAVAHQYADMGGYDVSTVADYWPGVDPAPAPPTPTAYEIGDDMQVIPVSFTTNANGWMAIDCPLPKGTGPHDVVSIMCDWATAYDPQGWQACTGSVDYAGSTADTVRLGFKSVHPNQFFTARVFVATPAAS